MTSAILLISAVLGSASPAPPRAAPPSDKPWTTLRAGLSSEKDGERVASVRVLGLIDRDETATGLAIEALADKNADVRAAAADALGQMRARGAVARLVEVLKKEADVSVVMAGARALITLGDARGYVVYYAILTGDRKAGGGLLESQKKMLKDPKKMAEFGFEQGIGFIPFAGLGYGAIKAIGRDDVSPVRAAAARILAKDRDPKTRAALITASSDKSWIVRVAALDALSRRGDASVVPEIAPRLEDDEEIVRYTAAAATIHLGGLGDKGR